MKRCGKYLLKIELNLIEANRAITQPSKSFSKKKKALSELGKLLFAQHEISFRSH